jgi:hypothetical protein
VKRVEITYDNVNNVVKGIQALTGQQVLVGIPEEKGARSNSDPVTNAALGYIHEFGSPQHNIPARPWLIPGVRKGARDYMPHLRGAAAAVLDGKTTVAFRELNMAGILAAQSAQNMMATGNFVPLSPATIRARRYSRTTKSIRVSEKQYLALIKQGVSPATAQSAVGIRPLINTRQLFNSVTYVVRKVK